MRGLLTKDFLLIKKQGTFFASLAAVLLLFAVLGMDIDYSLNYAGILMMIMLLGTIFMEEDQNGQALRLLFSSCILERETCSGEYSKKLCSYTGDIQWYFFGYAPVQQWRRWEYLWESV